jgi:hypothetical protein
LKFLGLTDDTGKPTPVFRELQTGGDEFRDALKDVVERSYDDLFGRLDVSRDSKDKIVNYFARNYSPATAERAARLFLDLCGEAGITTAAQPRKADPGKRGAAPQKPKPGTGQNTRQQQVQEQETEGSPGPRIDIRINSQDFANMDAAQIAAVFEGLVKVAGAYGVPTPQSDPTGE